MDSEGKQNMKPEHLMILAIAIITIIPLVFAIQAGRIDVKVLCFDDGCITTVPAGGTPHTTDTTVDDNETARNNFIADINLFYVHKTDENGTGRLPYTVIANPPWITEAGTQDGNAASICGDGLLLDGNGSCMPYVSTTAENWTGTWDNNAITDLLNRANHIGTQLAATISDFSTTVLALFSGTGPITFDSGTIGFQWSADFNTTWLDLFTGQNISLLNNDAGYITSAVADTNANTECGDGLLLDGNGSCMPYVSTVVGDWTGTLDGYEATQLLDNIDTNIFESAPSDCPAGQYLYGFNTNGTIDCRSTVTDGNTNFVQKGTTIPQNIDANFTVDNGGGSIQTIPDQNMTIWGTDPGNRLCRYYQDGNWVDGFC